jgi:hypothetical protein
VGVAVMQLKDIVEQVKAKWIPNSSTGFEIIKLGKKLNCLFTGFLRLLVGFGQALPHGWNWLDDPADLVTTHKRRSGSGVRQNEIGSSTWGIGHSTVVKSHSIPGTSRFSSVINSMFVPYVFHSGATRIVWVRGRGGDENKLHDSFFLCIALMDEELEDWKTNWR